MAQSSAQQLETFAQNSEKITLKEKLAYGMGDVGNNFLFDLGQLYLLKFYTDALGIPAAIAGLVFLVAKIWDAFADMSVGTWIDNRKNIGPKGKFRPFILYTAIPLALMTIVSFLHPGFSLNGRIIWAFLTYMLFGTVYSISNIPYGSMLPAMTKDTKMRGILASFRNGGSNLGLLLTTVGFMPIVLSFSNKSTGYLVAVAIFAVLGIICQWISYAGIKERYVVERPKESKGSIKEGYKSIFKNPPLLILCLINLLTFSAFNVKTAVQVYYAQYVLKDVSLMPYIGFFNIGCIFIGVALVPFLVKKIGKKSTYVIGAAIWAVGDILAFVFAKDAVTFISLACVAYLGYSFTSTLNWALVSDAVEFGEWKTGNRSEGVVYSFFTFFRKLSQAVAGFVPGVVLAFVGYVPNAVQSAGAISGIRGLMFIYPGILAVATVIIMGLCYKLSDEKFQEIVEELGKRKKSAV